MSKLFRRAKVYLYNATNTWKNREIDDSFVDSTCYNLHQTMEASLKFLIEINGANYVTNHDLRAQLNVLKRLGVEFAIFSKIADKASVYNSWEAETRYKDNFIALSSDVEEAFDVCGELISKIEELLKEQGVVRSVNSFD